MKRLICVLSLPVMALLAGCENGGASYSVDESKNHSISLLREQNIPFAAVTQTFVLARYPECQRRFPIGASKVEMLKVNLYEVRPMLYAAQQGNAWYALGTEECVLQVFKTPPEVIPPGRLVGSFEKKDGALVFKPAEAAKP